MKIKRKIKQKWDFNIYVQKEIYKNNIGIIAKLVLEKWIFRIKWPKIEKSEDIFFTQFGLQNWAYTQCD